VINGTQFQVEFDVTNYHPDLVFELWKASVADGGWTLDAGASFQNVTPNTRFRVTTSTAGANQAFYRVVAR
jgi:hypothetical protein